MRIGCFLQRVPKWKWTAPMIAILWAYSLLLRGVLLYMTCVVNAPHEGTVGSEVYTCQTSQVYDGIMLHRHCQFDLTCETTMTNLNIKWQQSIHSGMLRVCAGDIELNPGPNERHTRQTTLTPQAVEPKLADIMKEMKSMRSNITKRLDTIYKKVEGVQKNIRQIKTDHNELKGKVMLYMMKIDYCARNLMVWKDSHVETILLFVVFPRRLTAVRAGRIVNRHWEKA